MGRDGSAEVLGIDSNDEHGTSISRVTTTVKDVVLLKTIAIHMRVDKYENVTNQADKSSRRILFLRLGLFAATTILPIGLIRRSVSTNTLESHVLANLAFRALPSSFALALALLFLLWWVLRLRGEEPVEAALLFRADAF